MARITHNLEKSAKLDIYMVWRHLYKTPDYWQTGKALERTITELDQHTEDTLEYVGFKACD